MSTVNLASIINDWLIPSLIILLLLSFIGFVSSFILFWLIKQMKAYKKGGWDEVIKQNEVRDDWPPF